MAFNRNQTEDTNWPENVDIMQKCPSRRTSIGCSMSSYTKAMHFWFELELFRAQECWFELELSRAQECWFALYGEGQKERNMERETFVTYVGHGSSHGRLCGRT